MSEIAFVSPPALALGVEPAGLRACTVTDADLLHEKLLELAAEGVSVAVVTADLVGERSETLRSELQRAGAEMALLVLPSGEAAARDHLAYLRRKFAAALGVDVWDTAERRSGGGGS